METFVCWKYKVFGHFLYRCPKRVRKNRKSSLSNEDKEFKESIQIFLNDYDDKDNELELVKEEELVENNYVIVCFL